MSIKKVIRFSITCFINGLPARYLSAMSQDQTASLATISKGGNSFVIFLLYRWWDYDKERAECK